MSNLLPALEKPSVFVFLVSSMLAMGLTLTPEAIAAPLRNVRLVVLVLALNFVLAPAFAWLLTIVIPLERGHAIGLLLLGGAAGAPFLPKVVQTAGGDLALAAALMGLLTLGTIFFLPFALPWMIPGLQGDPWSIARPLVLLIVLPLVLGMLLQGTATTFAVRAAPVFARFGNAALLLLFVLLIALNVRSLLGVIGSGAILAALLYFTGLFIGGWLLGGSKPEVRGVLGLATAARNFGAALVPAASSFADPKVTIMIIVGAIVCLVVSFAAAGWLRRHARIAMKTFATFIFLALLTACTGLPKTGGRAPSHALTGGPRTALAKTVQPGLSAHPGQSGSYLLSNGHDAFAARLALVDAAERSLDLQYFIWNRDLTGKLLIERLLRAADRGVRVRVLLDDLGVMPTDRNLLALDSHPNVEVRLFNPIQFRSAKLFSAAFDFARVNRRMHNKAFIADGRVAIVGGRNIGDEYFDAHQEMNFTDLDVAMIGPVVREVSDAFDLYWNSRAAIAIGDLSQSRTAHLDFAALRTSLAAHTDDVGDSPYARSLRDCLLTGYLQKGSVPYDWGRAWMAYDHPDKVTTSTGDTGTHLLPKLRSLAAKTKKELFLISPYCVPGRKGVEFLRELRQRGVRVVLLTNSLASTDGWAAFSGYQHYRKALVRAGIELYESKAAAGAERVRKRWSIRGSSGASMHSKTAALDRRTLVVTSYNFDPRSKSLNTEIAAVIESPAIAASVPANLDPVLARETYRIALDGHSLVWVTREGGHEVRYYNEPATTFWRRFATMVLSWLPIEGQL